MATPIFSVRHLNEAAIELSLQHPGLLHTRKLLMETARAKVIEDRYQFVKGKSRSKKGQDESNGAPAPKRQKYSQQMRDERVKIIKEDCRDLSDRIHFKEKRIRSCENMRDYKKCDELKESLMSLKEKRQALECELKRIQKSNYQSSWYYRKKTARPSDLRQSKWVRLKV